MTATRHVQPEFRPHFDGLREGYIKFPVCANCSKANWYPLKLCRACQSDRFDWKTVATPPRLWSWTVVRRPFSPQWEGKVPYVVGLVEFDELPGTRLISNIVDCPPEELKIGAVLEPVFAEGEDGEPMVNFRPSRRTGEA